MADEIKWTEEASENFLENVFALYFDDELERKGLDRADFKKGQVFFKKPFASSQYDELAAGESEVEVFVNDDAEIKMIAELKPGESVKKGDEVDSSKIAGFKEVILDEEKEDFGHITVYEMEGVGTVFNFDVRANRSYYDPLIEAADQFIELAETAFKKNYWRAFVENAFHSAERMMKIEIIYFGWKAEGHHDVQARYNDLNELGTGNPELYNVFNKLKDTYRFSASYVDPRGDDDEKEFELDNETAKKFLDIIKEHRKNL